MIDWSPLVGPPQKKTKKAKTHQKKGNVVIIDTPSRDWLKRYKKRQSLHLMNDIEIKNT
jgi:predicted nucleic acid-binding Zn ribbon protein